MELVAGIITGLILGAILLSIGFRMGQSTYLGETISIGKPVAKHRGIIDRITRKDESFVADFETNEEIELEKVPNIIKEFTAKLRRK